MADPKRKSQPIHDWKHHRRLRFIAKPIFKVYPFRLHHHPPRKTILGWAQGKKNAIPSSCIYRLNWLWYCLWEDLGIDSWGALQISSLLSALSSHPSCSWTFHLFLCQVWLVRLSFLRYSFLLVRWPMLHILVQFLRLYYISCLCFQRTSMVPSFEREHFLYLLSSACFLWNYCFSLHLMPGAKNTTRCKFSK